MLEDNHLRWDLVPVDQWEDHQWEDRQWEDHQVREAHQWEVAHHSKEDQDLQDRDHLQVIQCIEAHPQEEIHLVND